MIGDTLVTYQSLCFTTLFRVSVICLSDVDYVGSLSFPMVSGAFAMLDDEYSSDSTEGGVEEESGPISLQYKKSKLFEPKATLEAKPHNTPGKLKSWQPLASK